VATVDQKLYLETAEGDDKPSWKLSASSPSELEELHRAEDAIHERLAQPLLDAGVDVLMTRKGIDDRVSRALMREGVLIVRRAKPEEILENVAAATGATVVGDVTHIRPSDLGRAGRVEELTFGPLEYTLVGECDGPAAVSILTRGGTWTSAEDTERGLTMALRATAAAVREPAVVPGGGFVEMRIARALGSAAEGTGTREALVLEAVAEAFEDVVGTLATNVGLNSVETLATLRARVTNGTAGVSDPLDDPARVGDPTDAGVYEPLCVKRAAVSSALQAAMHVVPIDEIIAVE
jgi:chaperonin GroEL (HSP60 family)